MLLVTPILYLGYRYQRNQNSPIPYPYTFVKNPQKVQIDAPILIIGDRLGHRLASFENHLAQLISTNLAKPIKILSIATQGEGLHRTLAKIKSLSRVPLITIYIGGSEETYEQKFYTRDMDTIMKNLELYQDDRIKTLLMIFPSLSRFIYHNIDYKRLGDKIEKDSSNYSDMTIQKRNMIHFKLFEQEIDELFSYLKEHNSYLMVLTQPLNVDIPPRKNCGGSLDQLADQKIEEITALIKKKDFKSAYNLSRELILIANSSAKAYYLHGKVAKQMGKLKEAFQSLELAMAYDCEQWRGNPVYNQIVRMSAKQNEVFLIDFQNYLFDYWTSNVLFTDEIHPQNYYYEKVADILALKIKKLLKL
jgi:tetratricopeptide (TPR) repeat protein